MTGYNEDDPLNDFQADVDDDEGLNYIGAHFGLQPTIQNNNYDDMLPGGDMPIDPRLLEELNIKDAILEDDDDVDDIKLESVPKGTVRKDSTRYEGCGLEGPLRGIFFAEFHPTAGPMIRCQAPSQGRDVVSKEAFEAFSVYIIPKPQLAK